VSDAIGWTVGEACAEFERAGMPVEERRLRAIIRNLPGFNPVGETKSGPIGGRGHPLYEIAQLQRLHAALAPWLTVRD
jgi:aromatic ring-cleaving dioxygenase